MNHLKMAGLIMAVMAMGYWALCLAGAERLMLDASLSAPGSCIQPVEVLNGFSSWPPEFPSTKGEASHVGSFRPLSKMKASETAMAGDTLIVKLNGSWGAHAVLFNAALNPDSTCQLNLKMESEQWPVYLRGMAILLGFRAAAQSELNEALIVWSEQASRP